MPTNRSILYYPLDPRQSCLDTSEGPGSCESGRAWLHGGFSCVPQSRRGRRDFQQRAVPDCPGCRAGWAGSTGPGSCSFMVVGMIPAGQPDGRACSRAAAAVMSAAHGQCSARRSRRRRPRRAGGLRLRTGAAAAAWVPTGGGACQGRASASRPAARRPARRSRTRPGSARSPSAVGSAARCP